MASCLKRLFTLLLFSTIACTRYIPVYAKLTDKPTHTRPRMRLIRPIQGNIPQWNEAYAFKRNDQTQPHATRRALARNKGVGRSHGSATNFTPLAGYVDFIPHFCRISVIGHHLVNAD